MEEMEIDDGGDRVFLVVGFCRSQAQQTQTLCAWRLPKRPQNAKRDKVINQIPPTTYRPQQQTWTAENQKNEHWLHRFGDSFNQNGGQQQNQQHNHQKTTQTIFYLTLKFVVKFL
jgi:hypothetical protein